MILEGADAGAPMVAVTEVVWLFFVVLVLGAVLGMAVLSWPGLAEGQLVQLVAG